MNLTDKIELLKRMILKGHVKQSHIASETGLDKKNVSRLKMGIVKIENMRVHTAQSLIDYLDQHLKQLTDNYNIDVTLDVQQIDNAFHIWIKNDNGDILEHLKY